MYKIILTSLLSIVALGVACSSGSTSSTTANANTANANLPPEFSTKPVEPTGNSTPGIPAGNVVTNKIPANTAGINPANAVRTLRPGEKIPGIDPEAARRQMQAANATAPPPTNSKGSPQKPANKP